MCVYSSVSWRLHLSRDIEDAIGINVKDDIDLGHSSGRGRDAGQLKFAQEVVIPRPGPLALKHLDEHSGLVVRVCREDLLLLGGDSSVAGDECGLQWQQQHHVKLASYSKHEQASAHHRDFQELCCGCRRI